ncbi:MAG TPA: GPW/gp25 family protein [Blastocatellia bacterium]|jgi:hypothetical protein
MRDFLGTSVSFPIRPDGKGGLALSSGVDAVEDSLRAIIESMRGSHLLEPWMGIRPLLFQPIRDLVAIAEEIKDAIIDGDDRVEESTLRVEAGVSDEGLMQIEVKYQIAGQADFRTLQHGFRVLN